MKNKFTLIALTLVAISIVCCKKESIVEYNCSGITPTYDGEIKPYWIPIVHFPDVIMHHQKKQALF